MSLITDPFTAVASLSTAGFRGEILSAQPGSPVIESTPSPEVERSRRLVSRLLAAAARRIEPVERRPVVCAVGRTAGT
ncbi:MAG: hypothetical protein ABIM89_17725 [Mycobacteriales bacterium]